MRTNTIVVVAAALLAAIAAAPVHARTWARTYGGVLSDSAGAACLTSDGGLAFTGTTLSFGEGHTFWVVKLGADGQVEWQKTYGAGGGHAIAQTADGGFIVGGRSWLDDSAADFKILKTDALGGVEWLNYYVGSEADKARAVFPVSGGGYFAAGETKSFGAGGAEMWALKLDSLGGVAWQTTYGGSLDEAANAAAPAGSGFVLAGSTTSFGSGGADVWVVRTDGAGKVQWQRAYGGNRDERAYAVQATADGGFVVAGSTNSFGGGSSTAALVMKLDSSGNVQWQGRYGTQGGGSVDEAYDVKQTSDGGYVVIGQKKASATGPGDVYVFKLDSSGVVQWQKTYGYAASDESGAAGNVTAAGDLWVAGRENSAFTAGRDDAWILKLDSQGAADPACNFISNNSAKASNNSASAASTSAPELSPLGTTLPQSAYEKSSYAAARERCPCPPLAVSAVVDDASACLGESPSYTAGASGGTAPFSFEWDFSYDGAAFNAEAAGNPVAYAHPEAGFYKVRVRATDGCAAPQQVYGNVDVRVVQTKAAPTAAPNPVPCLGIPADFAANPSGGTLVPVFFDSMEGGVNGWTIQDVSAFYANFWHQVAEPACSPSAYSGSTSWYFGVDSQCNFDNGNAIVAGRLVSPVLNNLPPNAVLHFKSRRHGECYCCFQDRSYVEISTNGGVSWDSVASICDNSDTWVHSGDINLNAYAGQNVMLGFLFHSDSPFDNQYTGWMVDDVLVGVPSYAYFWDLGNGDTSTQANFSYVYGAAGAYAATAAVTDSDGCSSGPVAVAGGPVVVQENLQPVIAESACDGSGNVTLDADVGYASYLWNNGKATQTIVVPGNGSSYAVMVTDANGCGGSASRTTSACSSCVAPLCAVISVSPSAAVCRGVAQTFTLDFSGGTPPLAVEWDWNNDGIFDAQGNGAAYTYPSAGAFTVRARATSLCDAAKYCEKTASLFVAALPDASFTHDAPKCAGDAVGFTAAASGGISSQIFFSDSADSLAGWTASANVDVQNFVAAPCTDGGGGYFRLSIDDQSSSVMRLIPTTGYRDIRIRANWRKQNLDAFECLSFQYTTDGGGSWATWLSRCSNGSPDALWVCGQASVILPSAANDNPLFGVRFAVTANAVDEQAWLDRVWVEGVSLSLSYCWDFDDSGGPCDAAAQGASFAYPLAGAYTARLTTSDGTCAASSTQSVAINGCGSTPPGEVTPASLAANGMLSWADLADEDNYEVFGAGAGTLPNITGPSPGAGDCLVRTLQNVTSYQTPAIGSGATWFYLIRGVNAAGNGTLGTGDGGSARYPTATACP